VSRKEPPILSVPTSHPTLSPYRISGTSQIILWRKRAREGKRLGQTHVLSSRDQKKWSSDFLSKLLIFDCPISQVLRVYKLHPEHKSETYFTVPKGQQADITAVIFSPSVTHFIHETKIKWYQVFIENSCKNSCYISTPYLLSLPKKEAVDTAPRDVSSKSSRFIKCYC
jgi:hypothetical protein